MVLKYEICSEKNNTANYFANFNRSHNDFTVFILQMFYCSVRMLLMNARLMSAWLESSQKLLNGTYIFIFEKLTRISDTISSALIENCPEIKR